MPSDTSKLNQAINDLNTQLTATVAGEDSAEVLITGIGAATTAAVTAALQQDDAANQTSIDAASAAIATVTQQFTASAAKLAAAQAAQGTQPAPTPAT